MKNLEDVNRSKFTVKEVLHDRRTQFSPHALGRTMWWIPKYRRKALFGTIRRELGAVLRQLAQQKECEIVDGKLMPDQVHMLISIPPKYAVSQVIGYLKGKSAIHSARIWGGWKQNFTGQHSWARG